MSRESDRWALPALERFGAQLREGDCVEPDAPARRSRQPSLPHLSLRSGFVGLLGGLAALAAVLEIVSPAGALSPVNRAPVVAERSKFVRFASSQMITLNGRHVLTVSERGALNFVNGAFATTLHVGEGRRQIERRRVGSTLYVEQVSERGSRAAEGNWSAIPLGTERAGSPSLPGGYTLIDPQVLFRVLASTRAPVTLLGRTQLRGQRVTEYRLSTTLAAFLAAEQGETLKGGLVGSGGATLSVWLDSLGRPVRAETIFLAHSRVGVARMSTNVTLAQYGAPIAVQAPTKVAISARGAHTPPSAFGDPVRSIERLLFPGRYDAGRQN